MYLSTLYRSVQTCVNTLIFFVHTFKSRYVGAHTSTVRENTPSKVVPHCYLKIDERAPLKVCQMYLLTLYGSVQKTPPVYHLRRC